MEDNKHKKLINDPDNKMVLDRIEDNANNTDSLENDEIRHTMSKDNNMPKGDEITYKLKSNTENTEKLENTTMKVNNENSIKKVKRGEEDIITNGNNNSRESEINRSNNLPERINNTDLKYSWAEESHKASLKELLEEDAKKMKIIEDLVKEREKWETELRNKDKIIQNLIKEKRERKIEETNIEENVNKGTQVRNIKTKIKELKWQLDIKNKEIRDIYDEVEDLLSRLDELESWERPLEYNRTRENKFQKQAKHNKNTYKINSGNKETRNNNFQNSYKTHEGRNYNWRKQPCRLHGQGHTAQECMTACGFCQLKGSHKSIDCWRKSEKINEFMEKWMATHGVAAKTTAEGLIRADKIIHPTKEEFENRLKGGPVQQRGFEGYKGNSRNNK